MPVYTFIGKPAESFTLLEDNTIWHWDEDISWSIGRSMKMSKVTLLDAYIQFQGVAYYASMRFEPKFITQAPACSSFYSGNFTAAESFNASLVGADRNSIVRLLDINDMFSGHDITNYANDAISAYNFVDQPVLLGNATHCNGGNVTVNFQANAFVDDEADLSPGTPYRVQFQLEIE